MDPEEAKNVTIPMAILASMDEDTAVRFGVIFVSRPFALAMSSWVWRKSRGKGGRDGGQPWLTRNICSQMINAFAGNLKHGHLVETFSDQVHGWMASK